MAKIKSIKDFINGYSGNSKDAMSMVKIKKIKDITLEETIEFTKLFTESCINIDDDGFYRIDYHLYDYYYALYFIYYFTNLDLTSDDDKNQITLNFEDYNFLTKKQILDTWYNQSNMERFNKILNKSLKQELKVKNSVAYVLSNKINVLLEKMPTVDELKESLPELLNGISDLQNKETIKKALE